MAPCWTLLAVLPPDASPAPDPAFLAQVIPQPGAPGRWVAHATPAWSRAHLEDDAATVRDALLRALGAGGPRPAAAHRWRFARTETPLGTPFLALAGGQVLAGGDWALGRDGDHAFASGRAMAAALSGQGAEPAL